METVTGIVFVLFAGAAVFAGVYKKDIEQGKMPEPVRVYMASN